MFFPVIVVVVDAMVECAVNVQIDKQPRQQQEVTVAVSARPA